MPMKKSLSMASVANTLRSINVFRDEPILDEQGRSEAEIQEERKNSISSTTQNQEDAVKVLQDDLVKALDTYRKASENKVFAHFKGPQETKASVEADFNRAAELKKTSTMAQKLSAPWFIVGGTGNIGMCLTEKLLRCTDAKLYLLVRKSTDRILEGWQRHMSAARAAHLKTILDEGKRVVCLLGDAELDNLGLTDEQIAMLTNEVEFAATTAGDINLKKPLVEIARPNVQHSINFAEFCIKLPKLKKCLVTSTAYVNAYLPEGAMPEEMVFDETYQMHDPEAEYASILKGDVPPAAVLNTFPWDYSYSKNLSERMLQVRYGKGIKGDQTPKLPLLFLRPSNVGPAIAEPHPGFSSIEATPITSCTMKIQATSTVKYRQAMSEYRALKKVVTDGKLHAPEPRNYRMQLWPESTLRPKGGNEINEVPVDLFINATLLHAVLGDAVVFNGSTLHKQPATLRSLLNAAGDRYRANILPVPMPDFVVTQIEKKQGLSFPEFAYVKSTDPFKDQRLCQTAQLMKVGGMQFDFDISKTLTLRDTLSGADATLFDLRSQYDIKKYLHDRGDLAFVKLLEHMKERVAKQKVDQLRLEIANMG